MPTKLSRSCRLCRAESGKQILYEAKGAVHPAFDIQLNVDELAAAGREVKRGTTYHSECGISNLKVNELVMRSLQAPIHTEIMHLAK